jgi:hypothetical protein
MVEFKLYMHSQAGAWERGKGFGLILGRITIVPFTSLATLWFSGIIVCIPYRGDMEDLAILN